MMHGPINIRTTISLWQGPSNPRSQLNSLLLGHELPKESSQLNGSSEARLSAGTAVQSGLSSTSRTTGLPDIAGFWISEYYN